MTSAVKIQDDKPVLELAAEEFIFPITTPDGHHKVLFHMKPYRPFVVKAFYDETLVRSKSTSRGERVLDVPTSEKLLRFVSDHFIRMEGVEGPDGSEPSIEMQRAFLDDNEQLKARVFRMGYDFVTVPDFAAGNGHSKLSLFGPAESDIDAQWLLHDSGIDHRIIVSHHTAKLAKVEFDKYQKAIRVIETNRDRYMQGNWDVVEQLYDAKILSLKGAVVEGQPCEDKNKKEWVGLVPFCMKVFVMGQLAQELETKNG